MKKKEIIYERFAPPILKAIVEECPTEEIEDDYVVIQEALDSKTDLCYSCWDTGGSFSVIDAGDNDVLQELAHQMLEAIGADDRFDVKIITRDGKVFDFEPEAKIVSYHLTESF